MRACLTGSFCLIICALFILSASGLQTSASSAVLIEADSGDILYEKNAHTQRPMASTTKIMTALVAIEAGRLDEIVTVSPAAAAVHGSSIYLRAGEQISVKNLLYGLLLESGNDAAAALAEHVSGSIDSFSALMNHRAAVMGLCSTSFQNPSGLPDKSHYTTAYELALIGRQGLRNALFAEIVGTKSYKAPIEGEKGVRHFTNGNRLLRLYPDATGMKTGFTKEAGRCLISSACKNGVCLIAVTLNDGNDWLDHIAMFDYGFERAAKGAVLFSKDVVLERRVGNGEKPVTLANNDGLQLYKGMSGGYKSVVSVKPCILAPVRAGAVLGAVSFVKNGRLAGSVPLIAQNDVNELPPQKPPRRLWERVKKLINSLLLY